MNMKLLLFCLGIYFCLNSAAFAEDVLDAGAIELMKQLENKAVQAKDEHGEYMQDLISSSQKIRKSVFGQTESGSQFYIFVTLGMKPKNIRELMDAAKRYGAIFVIRGLHKGSMSKTVQYLAKFTNDIGDGFIIDPTLFRKYGIAQVPAFVLSDGDQYDVLYGNVMPEFALREFAKKGDLSAQAKELLLQ
ncbi:type-F conjugative transfer system pilin assembly protein TrbC [Candidatus Lariskella endosymbiont of Hedychridium roseum]|uniref:type-F conjugative transfer system pilin assembly protein TrbC n=1 Tax=Candidatus Lariskella endosymbiont of Hedychridium roseum TaxID=3077949 RepID=UPI0030CC3B09